MSHIIPGRATVALVAIWTREQVMAHRIAQGMPPQVEDEETLKLLAVLLRTGTSKAVDNPGDNPVRRRRQIVKDPRS